MIASIILSVALVATPSVQSGVKSMPDSLYTHQSYYMPKKEGIRKCIMHRESRGNYRADGSGGSGAYSFIQSTWDHYASLAGFDNAVGVRPNKVRKYVQDAVFWRTFNHGKGKWHWSSRWNPGIKKCFPE